MLSWGFLLCTYPRLFARNASRLFTFRFFELCKRVSKSDFLLFVVKKTPFEVRTP